MHHRIDRRTKAAMAERRRAGRINRLGGLPGVPINTGGLAGHAKKKMRNMNWYIYIFIVAVWCFGFCWGFVVGRGKR